jgi:hypothetical protein
MARKRQQAPVAAQAQPDLTALIAETVQAYLSKQQRSVAKAAPEAKSQSGWRCVREDDPRKPGTVGFRFIKPNGETKARKSLAPENWALVREFWGYIEPQIAAFPLPSPEKK